MIPEFPTPKKILQYTISIHQTGTADIQIIEHQNTIGPITQVDNDGTFLYVQFPNIDFDETKIHMAGATTTLGSSANSLIIPLANPGQPNTNAKLYIQIYSESGKLALDIECLNADGTAAYLSAKIGANKLCLPTLYYYN